MLAWHPLMKLAIHVPASECDTLGLRRISRLALFTP
jgi:hypothetical protein